jgi:hypothetical protein
MNILKQLRLAYNEFKSSGVKEIARVVKTDTYLRSLDLRGNLINSDMIEELYNAFKDNESLFNFDIRENPGFEQKYGRTFALKMIANFTKVAYEYQKTNLPGWKNETEFFNPKFFEVEIPQTKVDSYAKKLKLINTNNIEEIAYTESSVSQKSPKPVHNRNKSWRLSDSSHYYSPRDKTPYRERGSKVLRNTLNLVIPNRATISSSTLKEIQMDELAQTQKLPSGKKIQKKGAIKTPKK